MAVLPSVANEIVFDTVAISWPLEWDRTFDMLILALIALATDPICLF